MTAITFTLPIPPSVNALFANVPGKGRIKTRRYKNWIADAGWLLRAQRPASIAGPYELSITVPPTRSDLGNLEKAVSDLIVLHGLVEDDSRAEKISIERCKSIRDAIVTIRPVIPGSPDHRTGRGK